MWNVLRLVDTGGETIGSVSWKFLPRIGETVIHEGLAYRVTDVIHNTDAERAILELEDKE